MWLHIAIPFRKTFFLLFLGNGFKGYSLNGFSHICILELTAVNRVSELIYATF